MIKIRDERAADAAAISALTTAAFANAPHSDGTEAAIIDALRANEALALSLVAEDDAGAIVGHIAFSPVTITDANGQVVQGWYGLGPVSVSPARQGEGIGAALIREGLARLQASGANGCVLLGDPAYYARFGFIADAGPTYPGPPPEYFQALAFPGHVMARGVVTYDGAFGGE